MPAITWAAIEAALLHWLQTATGWPVIWSHQAAPRPAAAYGTINPRLSLTRLGRAETRMTSTPGVVEIIQHHRLTISCNLLGGGAFEKMTEAQLRLSAPTTLDRFRAAGLALLDEGQVRDLTALVETKWEARAQMDVAFGLAGSITDAPGWIEQAGYSSTFNTGASSVEDTGTITS